MKSLPKEKFNFRLLVDDAHGFGTLGATGAGQERNKASKTISMFILPHLPSQWQVQEHLSQQIKTLLITQIQYAFTDVCKITANGACQRALKRLDMLRSMPELKANLWKNVHALQTGLRERGFDLGSTQSCVTPVYLKGKCPEAMVLVKDLRENFGIFCSIVVYPVFPKD